MMAELAVKVQPRSSKNRWEWTPLGLKVWLTAAPTDGQANAALCEFVADVVGVAKSRVTVIRGLTSRQKLLRIEGVELATLHAVFGMNP